jgi:MSHA biogenesis protein MshG
MPSGENMTTFRYKARDRDGKAVTGVLEGDSKGAVAEEIIRLGHVPVDIEVDQPAKKGARTDQLGWSLRFQRVRSEELIYFSRQLALIISAGVPLLRSLQVMAAQATNERLGRTLSAMAEGIEGGASLSEVMSNYPRIFSPLYVSMIRAGEVSGTLDATFNKLAALGEYEEEIRARIKTATRYPKMLSAALVVAFFVVVYFVIPNFAKLFEQMKADLPLPTRMMLAFNAWIQSYWLVSLLGLGITVAGILWWIQTKTGRYWFDRFKVTVPILGPLISRFTLSRFSRVFATLNGSGLPILTTLRLSTETLGNVYYASSLERVTEQVEGGQDLASSLGRSGIFPALLVQMVAVGETSGALDEVLQKVSEYYDQDVDYAIKRLSTLLEPLLLCVLAGFVLFMALSVFLPMWNMASVMTR